MESAPPFCASNSLNCSLPPRTSWLCCRSMAEPCPLLKTLQDECVVLWADVIQDNAITWRSLTVYTERLLRRNTLRSHHGNALDQKTTTKQPGQKEISSEAIFFLLPFCLSFVFTSRQVCVVQTEQISTAKEGMFVDNLLPPPSPHTTSATNRHTYTCHLLSSGHWPKNGYVKLAGEAPGGPSQVKKNAVQHGWLGGESTLQNDWTTKKGTEL